MWYRNFTREEFLSDGDVPAHAYDQVPDGSFSAVLLTQGTAQLQQVAVDGTPMLAHAGAELTTCGGGVTGSDECGAKVGGSKKSKVMPFWVYCCPLSVTSSVAV